MSRFLVVFAAIVSWQSALCAGEMQPQNREEVAAALLQAEALRACFSATSETVALYEVFGLPPGEFKATMFRISAGDGRYRQIVELHGDGGEVSGEDVCCWDGVEYRGIQRGVGPEATVRSAVIRNAHQSSDHLDELEGTFGLRLSFQATERTPPLSPGEALADPSVEAYWEFFDTPDGQRLRLTIVSPWNRIGPRFEYLYDVDKQYLPLRIVKRNYATVEDRDADANPSLIIEDEIVRYELIDEVWMPLEKLHTVHFTRKDEVFNCRMIFSDVTLNPEFDDETFTIDIATLPEGTMVGDNRQQISYKLGENLFYHDFSLYQTDKPIRDEITPDELPDLIRDSKRLDRPAPESPRS